MHGIGFLQWEMKQRGQPGRPFHKRFREVSKTPILSHHNNGSSREHECLVKRQIFPASREIQRDTCAAVSPGAILVGSALHSRKGIRDLFFSTAHACSPIPLAFANNFSTKRHRPPWRSRRLFLITNGEKKTKSTFLSCLEKHGASVGIRKNEQKESGETESTHSGAVHAFESLEREHRGADRSRIILPGKEVARKREGDGYIQPRDYHKMNPIEKV